MDKLIACPHCKTPFKTHNVTIECCGNTYTKRVGAKTYMLTNTKKKIDDYERFNVNDEAQSEGITWSGIGLGFSIVLNFICIGFLFLLATELIEVQELLGNRHDDFFTNGVVTRSLENEKSIANIDAIQSAMIEGHKFELQMQNEADAAVKRKLELMTNQLNAVGDVQVAVGQAESLKHFYSLVVRYIENLKANDIPFETLPEHIKILILSFTSTSPENVTKQIKKGEK